MPVPDDDDYVVSLLMKDAEANKKRYLSNSGLGSLLSKKPRGNAPRPNTRFLKSIVKEADSHNAALKAKEEEESRARLRDLKRKRDDDGDGARSVKRKEDRPGRWANALGGLSSRPREVRREESGSRRRSERETSREREHRHRRRRDDRERERSRSRSPAHRKERRRRSRSRSRTPPSRRRSASPFDSDHLEAILGPKPAPTILPRGRGAHKSYTNGSSNNIDARFSASYNPKTDVALEDGDAEDDDWDMALEALKDRAKWRAQGAERLRQAGFTEKEVERWEGSAAFPQKDKDDVDGDVSKVKWSRKGEDREWDRGKVLDGEAVDLRPKWARSKH